jgi:hypothetical protein
MEPLKDIETILFCDETKFSTNNGDVEDAIYYFGISVLKTDVPKISKEFKDLLIKHRIKTPTFHSTTVFKKGKGRQGLMEDLTKMFISYRLYCFCVKYEKSWMLEPTRNLNFLNSDIIDFNSQEFQALFYYLTTLNMYLQNSTLKLKEDILLFFDRNVYGKRETEEFRFPDENFIFNKMTFVNKSEISLLALPDFLGYIFRKSKISQNKVDQGDTSLETSEQVISSYDCMLKLNEAGLFKFIQTDENKIKEAIELISTENS